MALIIQNLLDFVGSLDYTGIIFLMALESSLFPVPSELVMIPAGWIAYNGGLNPFLATFAGWIGSLIGAWVNYVLGKYIGKPFITRYGKYFLITEEKYKKTEELFQRNALLYTFIGRFLPVIRHLISIPAGIFRMSIFQFAIITFLGATIWCGVLVYLGWTFGNEVVQIVQMYTHEIGIISIVLIGFWLWYKIFYKRKE